MQNMRMTVRGLEEQIKHRWCLASYLILNVNIRELVALADRDLPEKFTNEMARLVDEYMNKDVTPPAAIAQTVLNVSEDIAAGRPVELRAGDYIAAQQFFRGK